MTNITKLACAFVLAGGLATPAFAASPGAANNDQNTSNSQNAMTNDQNAQAGQQQMTNPMHISRKLRSDLSKAGFTDITIMPSSFMVRAKDSQGNPVMMVINPDSITAITEQNQGTNAASNANHDNGQMKTNNGATPGPASSGGSQPVTPGTQKP